MRTKVWCCLQVKLCDPCVSSLRTRYLSSRALYKSTHRYLYLYLYCFFERIEWRCIVSQITRDIGRKSRFPVHLATPLWGSSRNAIPFGMEKPEYCGDPTVKKFDDMSSRFDIPSCNGRTDVLQQHCSKKLSYRRETAGRFVSLNISLSHSGSLKII